jgi:hypothetical protein
MPDGDVIPWPPATPPGPIPIAEEFVDLWRLHWEDDPRAPKVHVPGRYRFDAPAGEFPVCYGNVDRLACFAEVYGDTKLILDGQARRRLSKLTSLRPLRLIALDDEVTFHALGLDNRISTTRPYDRTQAWGLALHGWFPDADGLRFAGRNAGNRFLNYALFLDRCAGDLVVFRLGELRDLRPTALAAAQKFSLRCEIIWVR